MKSSLRSRFLAVCDISCLEMPSRVALLMVFLHLFVFYSFLNGLGYSLLMYFGREKTAKEGGKISERIPVKVEPPFANAVQGYGA